MNLKVIILCGAAACLAGAAFYLGLSALHRHTSSGEKAEEDGGAAGSRTAVQTPDDTESMEITDFECVFSLFAHTDPGSLENRVYTLKARVDGESVSGSIEWYDREGASDKKSFTADASFMSELGQTVSDKCLAKYNGCVYRVNGLPDMYGASLDIGYAFGAHIYAYDNQDCFLDLNSMESLAALFYSACGGSVS